MNINRFVASFTVAAALSSAVGCAAPASDEANADVAVGQTTQALRLTDIDPELLDAVFKCKSLIESGDPADIEAVLAEAKASGFRCVAPPEEAKLEDPFAAHTTRVGEERVENDGGTCECTTLHAPCVATCRPTTALAMQSKQAQQGAWEWSGDVRAWWSGNCRVADATSKAFVCTNHTKQEFWNAGSFALLRGVRTCESDVLVKNTGSVAVTVYVEPDHDVLGLNVTTGHLKLEPGATTRVRTRERSSYSVFMVPWGDVATGVISLEATLVSTSLICRASPR